MCNSHDKNRIKTKFMSSQAFHQTSCRHVQETTVWKKLKLENLELFDPVAQEYDQNKFLQQFTHTTNKNKKSQSYEIQSLGEAPLQALDFTEERAGRPMPQEGRFNTASLKASTAETKSETTSGSWRAVAKYRDTELSKMSAARYGSREQIPRPPVAGFEDKLNTRERENPY
jgi:hypothetical protein